MLHNPTACRCCKRYPAHGCAVFRKEALALRDGLVNQLRGTHSIKKEYSEHGLPKDELLLQIERLHLLEGQPDPEPRLRGNKVRYPG